MPNTRANLIKLLAFVQNAPENVNRDIMTFSAFMDDAELASHIISNARAMSEDRQGTLVIMVRGMSEASVKEAA